MPTVFPDRDLLLVSAQSSVGSVKILFIWLCWVFKDDLDFIFAVGGFGSQLRAHKNNQRRVGFGASMEE